MSQETFQPDGVRVGGATYTADDVGEVLDQLAARNAELTAIEARVAADRRVLDAAGRLVDRMKQAVGDSDSAAQQWLPPDSYELFAAVDALRALTGEQAEGAARHGYTSHGWPCCDQATPQTPAAIAKCGGPGLCKRVCGAEVATLHEQ